MIRTVGDLKRALERFDENLPVIYRQSEGDGYCSDWKLHEPAVFFPGPEVCISAFERVEYESSQSGRKE